MRQTSSSESLSLCATFKEVTDRTVGTWKRLKSKCTGHPGLFFLCQWPWKMLADPCFAAHPKNLVLRVWPDWCWYFYCRSSTVLCYLCCLWFSDRTLRLNIPHGFHAEAFGAGWSTKGQYTLAQIFGDLAEIQRPLLFTPVTCSLTGVHQMLQAACTVPRISFGGDVISTLEQTVRTVSMAFRLNVI